MKWYILLASILVGLLTGCGSGPVPGTAAPSQTPAVVTPIPSASPSPTLSPTPTLGAGAVRLSPADGMEMVYVPEGPFLMGSLDGYGDEKPQHTVTLSAFWIDRTEVTNAHYALCVEAGACQPPRRRTSNLIDYYWGFDEYADYPVIHISWDDAQAYCQWAGRRLPSEAEWEKAARGPDGFIYPWGNEPPGEELLTFDHNWNDVTRVGSTPAGASPYGALDMSGNVLEWVADWYSPDYYAQSPEDAPPGPETGERRVLRGGSWSYNANGVRSAYRHAREPVFTSHEVGFRCASEITP